jgi:hypothetical protein
LRGLAERRKQVVTTHWTGKELVKVIYVPGKILTLVVK